MSLFHFSLFIHFVFWIPQISEIISYLSFCEWLISHSTIPSRSIPVVADGKISFFLMADSSVLSVFQSCYSTIFSLALFSLRNLPLSLFLHMKHDFLFHLLHFRFSLLHWFWDIQLGCDLVSFFNVSCVWGSFIVLDEWLYTFLQTWKFFNHYFFKYVFSLSCGEPFQVWEMWLSPHLENQWGARLAGRTHIHG